jgi:hypothetical protein
MTKFTIIFIFTPDLTKLFFHGLDSMPHSGTVYVKLCVCVCVCVCKYEDVSKTFRTGLLERELQMVELSATRCSCIAIL